MQGDRQKVTVRYDISKFARYNYYHDIICDHDMSFFAGFDEMLILYYVCYNLFATFNKALTILMYKLYSMKVINLMIMYISIGQYKSYRLTVRLCKG